MFFKVRDLGSVFSGSGKFWKSHDLDDISDTDVFTDPAFGFLEDGWLTFGIYIAARHPDPIEWLTKPKEVPWVLVEVMINRRGEKHTDEDLPFIVPRKRKTEVSCFPETRPLSEVIREVLFMLLSFLRSVL